MKYKHGRTICIILSMIMIISMTPAGMAWAISDGSLEENPPEASVSSETSGQVSDEPSGSASSETEYDEKVNQEAEGASSYDDEQVNEEMPVLDGSENNESQQTEFSPDEDADEVEIDENIENGKVTTAFDDEKCIVTAEPSDDYDLATIRVIYYDREEYLSFEARGGVYIAEFIPEGSCSVTAFFMNTKKWDGSVDVEWYDPSSSSFDISTPAQLAGLAAITNGMVDENETEEWMIRDNEGRKYENGVFTHMFISTEPQIADLLTPNKDAPVRDTVWRQPKREQTYLGDDDNYNDFKYRVINLTADIDMSGANWTPIGGKYAMNPDVTSSGKDAKVIDARFHGKFDGNGHTVTIECERVAKLGFAYSWNIGLIGFLGGGVDYKNGYPKDTYIEYAGEWVPTVRNVVVRGSVSGRRIVGGVVGRIGETNYGVVVEKCANYADVSATDMRGCAGIVAAPWGESIIRNCYNAGTVKSAYWEHGGIVGSNGYEGSGSYEERYDSFGALGASVYNCYNIGDTGLEEGDSIKYDGQEIGVDGNAFAKYQIANCYYLAPENKLDKSGYSRGDVNTNTRARLFNVESVSDMNSDDVLDSLNQNGNVFEKDTEGINSSINGGGPILYFQSSSYQSHAGEECSIDIKTSENGSISAAKLSGIAYGTTVELSKVPKQSYRFAEYSITDGNEKKSAKYGDFYTVTGRNVEITGRFESIPAVTITFPEKTEHPPYYVVATKVYDATTRSECYEPLNSGDELIVGDHVKLVPLMKKTVINDKGEEEPIHPDLKTLEYTGELGDVKCEENALSRVGIALDKTYEVTGETDEINIEYTPKTQGKRWTSVADTSWYKKGTNSFTITSARQLAGVAKLCEDGVEFSGVTIVLGNDITLENTEANSGDKFPSERSWIGIGTAYHPFRGTFDGKGHSIKYLYRNFFSGYCPGSNGGLFGVTEGATIKNVNVEGGVYTITYVEDEASKEVKKEMYCGFINNATGGGIVGDAIDTTISKCSSNIEMNEAGEAGGIAGTIEGKTVIENCVSNGDIRANKKNAGGIVGSLDASNGAVIKNCVNNGQIESVSYNVGGILGYGSACQTSIKSCANNGSINVQTKGASGQSSGAAGGILGYATGNISVEESCNKGDICAGKTTYSVGGIAGAVTNAKISNCYNTGNMILERSGDKYQLSGIANLGTKKADIASVKNCYNSGSLSIGEGDKSSNIGGVVGYNNSIDSIISNCYCSTSSVSLIEGVTAGKAGKVVDDDVLKGYAKTLGSSYFKDYKNLNGGYPVFAYEMLPYIATTTVNKVSKYSDTALTVTWAGTTSGGREKSGYELWRATSAAGTYSKVYTGTAVKYTNKKLTYGKTYYYKVRAYKTVDGAKCYGTWSNVKSYSLVPGKTTLSSAKNSKRKTVVVKWKKVSGASGYQVYRSTKSTGGFKKVATIKKGSTVTYTNKKLSKGKTYYYKVRAYKTVNKKTGYGAYSSVKYAKVKK